MLTRSLFLVLLITSPSLPAEVLILDAWLREPPPIPIPVAGYLQIKNEYAREIRLVEASSPQFERIEFHTTEWEDDVARMRQRSVITIQPGETYRFEPGKDHLMLFKPKRPVTRGQAIELSLRLESGEVIPVRAEVRKATAQDAHSHHHHAH